MGLEKKKNSYKACSSYSRQFNQEMNKFLLLWKPWKGTTELKEQPASGTACVATVVSLSGKYFKIHTGKKHHSKSTFNNRRILK